MYITKYNIQTKQGRMLILGDASQRYNIMFNTGLPHEEAYEAALQIGDKWLENNQESTKGMEITRWDEWKSNPVYGAMHRHVMELYHSDSSFYATLQNKINKAWVQNCPTTYNKELFFSLFEARLLEEIAVLATAYETMGTTNPYFEKFPKLGHMFIQSIGEDIPTNTPDPMAA